MFCRSKEGPFAQGLNVRFKHRDLLCSRQSNTAPSGAAVCSSIVLRGFYGGDCTRFNLHPHSPIPCGLPTCSRSYRPSAVPPARRPAACRDVRRANDPPIWPGLDHVPGGPGTRLRGCSVATFREGARQREVLGSGYDLAPSGRGCKPLSGVLLGAGAPLGLGTPSVLRPAARVPFEPYDLY